MDISVWNKAVEALEKKDYREARALFQNLGEYDEAQLQLAFLLQQGLGGNVDLEEAERLYRSLVAKSHSGGMYFLAKLLMSTGKIDESVKYFEMASANGDVSGAYWAAALHGGLYGCPGDAEKHQIFLERAAALGHIYAQRDLALACAKKAGNPLDATKAWLRFVGALAKGVALTIKNPRDFRIR